MTTIIMHGAEPLLVILLLALATSCEAGLFGKGKPNKSPNDQQLVPFDSNKMDKFKEWQQSQHYQDYMSQQQQAGQNRQSSPPESNTLTIWKPTSDSNQPQLPKVSPFNPPRQALAFKNNDNNNNPFRQSDGNGKLPLVPSTANFGHRNDDGLSLVPAKPNGYDEPSMPYRRPTDLPQLPSRPKPSNDLKIGWKPQPKFFEPPQYQQQPMPLPGPEKKEPPTENEVRMAYKELFVWSDKLDSNRVLKNIDILNRWEGGGLEGKIPISLGRIEDWSHLTEENCKNYDMLKDMQVLLDKITYEHQHKSLETYVRECLNRYKELCNFNGRAVESFDNFKSEDEERWEMLKLWNYKVEQFGKRHTKWGKSDHSTNTFQLNEALKEICEEHGGNRYDKYQFGYRMVTALRVYCDQMSHMKGVLGATTLHKDWKRDKEIKEFHKLMSVCVQTLDANYLMALQHYI